jgi:polar amino acid transport system substrate-binding protein
MLIRLVLFAFSLLALPGHGAELVFAVSTGSAMPMTDFRDGALSGGLLKDFGDALAHEMKMTPRYLPVPRKRVESVVDSGQADLVCDLRPEWVDNKRWKWSVTVFTNHMIVANRFGTPPLQQLDELADRRIGTILGYRYPELEAVLGARFVRDEALNDNINLDKLLRKRFDYVMTNALFYDFQRKTHAERRDLGKTAFRVTAFDTYCGAAPSAKFDLVHVNRAIVALRKRGELQAIMDRYRPPP